MLKLTAIVSLMLIGSTLWAAGLSCDSCGSECASACGTRHFRSCCFNYLRRKRGNDVGMKFWPQPLPETLQSLQNQQYPNLPLVVMDNTQNMPEPWMQSEYKPYHLEDTFGNRVQIVYDA